MIDTNDIRNRLSQNTAIDASPLNTIVSVPHDEFELDDEATSYAENKPEGYSLGGAFKDGALWMIGHLKKKAH